ncbi:uncharacterized protein N7459_000721 [Penicillium hispanicum]|uniref:uncharacterized protein n=1 Tax=Penicillium hispanicum TaxID=1080232 RepID=UPI002542167C|nr:uncharacterized protein N7459_000721 [Penicillium hispanicum]KAJ5594513.1 hypothetical protein N7459_000721 [Penicillium hispanicum]
MSSFARGQRTLQSSARGYILPPVPLHSFIQPFSTSPTQTGPSSQSPPEQHSKSSTTPPETVTVPSAQDINAPVSTFPADLNLPPSISASATTPDKLQRYIALGRAYLTFYKTGLKNVFRNYRASLPLRARLGLPAYLPISPPRKISAPETNVANAFRDQSHHLGRGQFQLVRRSARDVRRMIPFTLILIVCGEFTPLIVPIVGSAITPATCRVPGQIDKERGAASKRKYSALRAHALAASGASASAGPVQAGSNEELALLVEFAQPLWAVRADAGAVLRASAVFGLVKRHDRFAGAALAGLVYRPRLRRYLEYLAIDDGMIRSGGGVDAMSAAEVRVACDERGAGDFVSMAGHEKAESLERQWLKKWLVVRGGKKIAGQV